MEGYWEEQPREMVLIYTDTFQQRRHTLPTILNAHAHDTFGHPDTPVPRSPSNPPIVNITPEPRDMPSRVSQTGDLPQMQVHGTATLLEHSLNRPIQLDSPVCRLKELKLLLTRRNIILGLIESHLAWFIPSPHSYLQIHFY